MAAVSVIFDGANISFAETITDGGNWYEWGTTKAAILETDFVLQNTYAVSLKVSNTRKGVELNATSSVDLTTPRVIVAKAMVSTSAILDLTVVDGWSYQIGNDSTNQYNYYLVGLYAGPYPATRSWIIIVIDPNEIAWRDAIAGTPALATADWFAHFADLSALVKAENVIHDRLDYMTAGTGHTLTGGDSTDPDGTFQDFLDHDEGTVNNRMMVVSEGESELIVFGVLTIGTATAAVFTDANFFLVFPHARVGVGFFGIDIDLQSATTAISFTAGVFKSLGNASTKKFFDTALQVNGTTEVITIPDHGFSTGDYVLYSDEGGTALTGLTDATYYFVRYITDDTFAVYAVGATVGRQNSFTDTTRVGLTADSAPGENHSFIRAPDTRADHYVSGTSGSLEWGACSIDGARIITMTSACDFIGGFILRAGNIILSTGALTGVSISTPTTEEGVALLTPLTPAAFEGITECSFTSNGKSHAIELTSADASERISNNTYTGFWAPTALGWNFHTQTGVEPTGDIITTDAAHGLADGDAVFYNKEGGTDDIGLDEEVEIDSYATGTDFHTLYSGVTIAAAQSFLNPTEKKLTSATFSLRKVGDPPSFLIARLYAHSGTFGTSSVPTGSVLASSLQVLTSSLGTSFADFTFDFMWTTPYVMQADTHYVVTVTHSTGDVSNYVDVQKDNAGSHAGNSSSFFGSWSAGANVDTRFSINTYRGPYYIGLLSSTTFTMHLTKAAALVPSSPIALTDGVAGQTQSLYSANATIFQDSGGAVTIGVTTGSTAPSIRNGMGASTTVNAGVSVSIEVLDVDKLPIENAQTSVYFLNSPYTEVMNKDTNSSGIAVVTYGGTTPIDVVVKVRKSEDTDDPRYFAYSSIQEISTSGLTLLVTLEVNPFL